MSGSEREPEGSAAKQGRREATKAANRKAILKAAHEVFAELGYGATSVRDIIRRTGLASGTFYNYFKSKEEVYEALTDESALQIRPHLRQMRRDAMSAEDFIFKTFEAFFRFCNEDKGAYELLRRATGEMRFRMDSAEMLNGYKELREDLQEAIDRGLLPAIDTEYLASSIYGIGFEVADRMVARQPPDVEGATKFASRFVLGGIIAQSQDG